MFRDTRPIAGSVYSADESRARPPAEPRTSPAAGSGHDARGSPP